MRAKFVIAFFAAATLLSGCKTEEGSDFNPTALGFDLASGAAKKVIVTVDEVETLLRFDEYLAADDDERTAVQDKWFYSTRIVERESGEWHLIGICGDEMVVLTGGAPLGTAGTEWRYRFCGRTYDDGDLPSISNISDGTSVRYKLRAAEAFSRYSVWGTVNLELEFTPYELSSDGVTESCFKIGIVSDGEQTVDGRYAYHLCESFTFRTLSPLHYDTGIGCFTAGRIATTATIEGVSYSPETEFSTQGMTVYGGADNSFSRTYGNYYLYY